MMIPTISASQMSRDPSYTVALKNLQAIGSISAASNSLVLDAAIAFSVNDKIIIETGGEAGGGARGTVGVGGVFPTLHYADAAAMDADTTQENNTWGYLDDTLEAKRWLSADSQWNSYPTQYYWNTIMPRALYATITAISMDGLTLTLNASAVVDAANANIYFDNTSVVTSFYSGHTGDNVKAIFPEGNFAVGALVNLQPGRSNWVITGQGSAKTKLFSPNGAICLEFQLYQFTNSIVQNMAFIGNCRNSGYNREWDAAGKIPTNEPIPLSFGLCTNCVAQGVKAGDGFTGTIKAGYGTVWAYNCVIEMTDALQTYGQWCFSWAGGFGGGVKYSTLTSPYIVAGFECFSADGAQFIGCTANNGVFSTNGSDNFLFEDCTAIISNNSQLSEQSFSYHNPIFNINSNIGPSGTGRVVRPTIIQQGFMNATTKNLFQGIIINVGSDNVSIEGTYPDCNGKGYIEIPDWQSPGDVFGGCGVNSNADGTTVTGIRFKGKSDYAGNVGNVHAGAGATSVDNCVMDHAATGTHITSQTGTISNATYEAGCP